MGSARASPAVAPRVEAAPSRSRWESSAPRRRAGEGRSPPSSLAAAGSPSPPARGSSRSVASPPEASSWPRSAPPPRSTQAPPATWPPTGRPSLPRPPRPVPGWPPASTVPCSLRRLASPPPPQRLSWAQCQGLRRALYQALLWEPRSPPPASSLQTAIPPAAASCPVPCAPAPPAESDASPSTPVAARSPAVARAAAARTSGRSCFRRAPAARNGGKRACAHQPTT